MSGVRSAQRPYRALLRQPGVRWQAISGLLAQVTQGASGVCLILLVRQHTGSLALAGGVVGATSVAAGIARPVQGRLIDRRGAAGVVAVTSIAHAVALLAIVVSVTNHAPAVLLLALGAAAGAALPPISSAMRVGWGRRVGSDERTAAYSLVYLVQELSILIGPLIVAAVIATADTAAAIVVVAVATAGGGLWFASAAAPPGDLPPAAVSASGSVLRSRGVQRVVAVAALVGGVIGALGVAAPTLALAHRQPAASGLLIGALSMGGITGAALYASRPWRFDASRRLVLILPCLTIAVLVAGLPRSLVVVGVLLLATGVAINPSLTTISLLLDRQSPGGASAEAFGWLSTGLASGTGAASAIAGAVTQHGGSARPAFVVAAVSALAATAVAVAHDRIRPSGARNSHDELRRERCG